MPRIPRIPLLILIGFVAVAPIATNSADSTSCKVAAALPVEGAYPEHSLSPRESLRHHDVVFLGEVVVPPRKCSLGWCAGLRVQQVVKGDPGANTLLQLTPPGSIDCPPASFQLKGARWLVFANAGTSRTGYRYFQAEDDGPSFAARETPDFDQLEGHYRQLRARLDQALESHLR